MDPQGLTPRTEFQGTCHECGRPAHYTPLVPRGRSRAYAPHSAFLNVRCGDCGSKVQLTATACTVCHVQAILKDSEFFAARGLDWPMTVVLTPGGGAVRVHKACASEAESAVRHAGDLDIDVAGVGRWTTNNHVIPDESAAMLIALGLAQGLDPEATAAARETETRAFLAAYRANPPVVDAEQLAEMRAAFGEGVTVVNVITGQETQL
jgi:hypothetical protein